MSRQDVVAIVNAGPSLNSMLRNRADKLLNLFEMLESGRYNTYSVVYVEHQRFLDPDTFTQREQENLRLTQELRFDNCKQQVLHEASVISIIGTSPGQEAYGLKEEIGSAITENISRPPSPVAALSPEEAAEIAGEQWASWVQHRAWDAALGGEHLPAKIVILRFSRYERALDDVVLESEVAKRAAMQGADLCPTWARGAKVLLADVGPELFDQDLEHFNVVVKEEDETELLRELEEKLPHRQRQLKAGSGRSMVPDKLSLFNVSQGDASSSSGTVLDMTGMRVVRTFIDIPRARPQVKSSNSW
jgi:hypothetical protein